MSHKRQVQVPHRYFQKAKSEYSDWRYAMIREFIQNSYDALATSIDFSLSVNSNNGLELTVADNGVGMDQDTLENVLLCMGGTRKPDGSIGGFGYAKAILFFAHHHYSIQTRDLLVNGSGGEYSLTHQAASIAGTRVIVEIDDEESMLPVWQDQIQSYISTCFMEYATGRAVSIRLDGEVLPQNNDRIYEFNVQTPLGAMWYDEIKDTSRSTFVVSVAGLPMFEETFYSDANQTALVGGIELEGGSTMLTSNRDGFVSSVRDEFAQVAGSLMQSQSAIRVGLALDLSINFERSADLPALKGTAVSDGADPQHDGESAGLNAPLILSNQVKDDPAALSGYVAALCRIAHERYPANFHMKVESLSVRRTAKSQAYITAPALAAEMNKQRNIRLAHSWRAVLMTILCCDWALANGVVFYSADGQIDDWGAHNGDISSLHAYFCDRRVDAGFCFIDGVEGLCSNPNDDNTPHCIYINPLLLTAETGFRFGDTLDLAFHEAAHLWERHHGEAFCGIEGKLRQSIRRWLSEKELLTRLANAVTQSRLAPATLVLHSRNY